VACAVCIICGYLSRPSAAKGAHWFVGGSSKPLRHLRACCVLVQHAVTGGFAVVLLSYKRVKAATRDWDLFTVQSNMPIIDLKDKVLIN